MAVRALQALIARRGRGRALYRVAARMVGAGLTARIPGAGAWVRGSVARNELLPGVSDLDLVVVVPDGNRKPVERRRRLVRGPIGVAIYEARELRAAVAAPLRFHPGLEDELWLRTRPGLFGPTDGWRRIAGSGELPAAGARDAQSQRLAAWLELQWWWRHAIGACLKLDRPHVPWLLVKLATEPSRVLTCLRSGERLPRAAAIAELQPDERAVVAEILADPTRMPARAPQTLLEACARGTHAVADLLAAQAPAAPLFGGSGPRPLRDARARLFPPRPDETVTVRAGSLGDPGAVAAAARDTPPGGPYVALRDGGLMLIPTDSVWAHGWMRTLHSTAGEALFARLEA